MTRARDVANTSEVVIASGSFSGVSAVNINNALSDTYKFYTLNIYANCTSSFTNLNLRFRENTTDLAGSGYTVASFSQSVAGTNGNYGSSGGTSTIDLTNIVSAAPSDITVNLTRISATTGLYNWQCYDGYYNEAVFGGGKNSGATNFNGISFYPSASTISGNYILTGKRL